MHLFSNRKHVHNVRITTIKHAIIIKHTKSIKEVSYKQIAHSKHANSPPTYTSPVDIANIDTQLAIHLL